MKKYAPCILLLFLFACHRTQNIGINGALNSDFGFKTGSYWIYQDSVSGGTDSVYVDTTMVYWEEGGGCVRMHNAPQVEYMFIRMRVWDGNISDSESWRIDMTENKLSAAFTNNRDAVAWQMGELTLFTYPITNGDAPNGNGCILTEDSGTIKGMGSCAPGGNQGYDNVAQSAHASRQPKPGLSLSYNDCFYTSPRVGFVRLVFNHPADSVYRVLNLVRYHVVK
jgi:hypothetical protein